MIVVNLELNSDHSDTVSKSNCKAIFDICDEESSRSSISFKFTYRLDSSHEVNVAVGAVNPILGILSRHLVLIELLGIDVSTDRQTRLDRLG